MLRSASRLPGRCLRAGKSQQLYRAPLWSTPESRCFTTSHHRPSSSSSRDAGDPSHASTPSTSGGMDPKVDPWSLRKKLRNMTNRILPETSESVQGGGSVVEKAWRSPSRPKADKNPLRRWAENQRNKETILADGKYAVESKRELLRNQNSETRAQANVQRQKVRRETQAERESWDSMFSSMAASTGNPNFTSTEKTKFNGTVTDVESSAIGNLIGNFPSFLSEEKSTPSKRWGNDYLEKDDMIEKFFPKSKTSSDDPISSTNNSTIESKDYSDRDVAPHLKFRKDEEPNQRHSRSTNETQTELIRGASIAYHRRIEPAADLNGVRCTTSSNYLPVDQIPTQSDEKRVWWDQEGKWTWAVGGKLSAAEVPLENIDPLRVMEVPQLAHGLDRVLFNPGVHWLRDVRSGIYNFEPKIRNLQDVDLFDYSALPPYQTSSKDAELAELVRQLSKRYSGSTSSMTALLSHIYFMISAWKQPDLTGYSSGFASLPKTFSFGAKLPANIVLRRFEEQVGDETKVRYAIDADKTAEGSANNNYILMNLGKSVEKLLTSSVDDYSKYLRLNSHVLTQDEKEKKEAYHYAATGKILMRSQLDCYDERLPRKTFDLKTRAVVAVRQDRANWAESSGYMIRQQTGTFESFEREMWDMTRAALLKYYFQARIGNMDGILVAYHSTATVFGFQYLPCEDMAMKLFGSLEMGEQAFRLSIGFLERLLDTITDIKPDHSLKITLDTELRENPKMFAFVKAIDEGLAEDSAAEDVVEDNLLEEDVVQEDSVFEEEQLEASTLNEAEQGELDYQSREEIPEDRHRQVLQLDIQVDRYLGEELVEGPVDFTIPSGHRINEAMEDEISRRKRASLPPLNWSIEYCITPRGDLSHQDVKRNLQKIMSRKENLAPLILPNLEALNERERLREEELSKDEAVLQKFYQDRKSGLAMGMPVAPGQVQAEETKLSVSTSDGDAIISATADLEEVKEKPQQWKKRTSSIERLRELARLGKEDKDKEALTDTLQIYERRGD